MQGADFIQRNDLRLFTNQFTDLLDDLRCRRLAAISSPLVSSASTNAVPARMIPMIIEATLLITGIL